MSPDFIREFRRRALAQGWTRRQTKDGEMWFPRSGHRPITLHTSHPNETRRGAENFKAQARRAGLEW